MKAEKKYYLPIAILVVLIGLALFLLLAVQAGNQFRPVAVQGEESTGVTMPLAGQNSDSVSDGPVRLIIPSISLDVNVQHVGLTAKNEIGIPNNFTDVAWYTDSAEPGQAGNAVIDGHLNDRLSRPAVFWDLDKLKTGDEVLVKDAKGVTFVFKVRTSETYDVHSAPMEKIIGPVSGAHLNLITCSGTWIHDAHMYDQRRVVFTDLVGTR